MAGASIEATLELWASSLRDVKERMRPLFILADGGSRAILGRGRWEADDLLDIVRGYTLETLPTMMRFW